MTGTPLQNWEPGTVLETSHAHLIVEELGRKSLSSILPNKTELTCWRVQRQSHYSYYNAQCIYAQRLKLCCIAIVLRSPGNRLCSAARVLASTVQKCGSPDALSYSHS